MDIEYLTIFNFDYQEIAGECGEIDWKRVDFRKDKPVYKTGAILVYLDFNFPPCAPGEAVKKPQYSGKFVVRRVKQTVRNHPGITTGFVAMLLEETESTKKIEKEVSKIIAKYAKEGGLIPLP